jgi:hypothetical protein
VRKLNHAYTRWTRARLVQKRDATLDEMNTTISGQIKIRRRSHQPSVGVDHVTKLPWQSRNPMGQFQIGRSAMLVDIAEDSFLKFPVFADIFFIRATVWGQRECLGNSDAPGTSQCRKRCMFMLGHSSFYRSGPRSLNFFTAAQNAYINGSKVTNLLVKNLIRFFRCCCKRFDSVCVHGDRSCKLAGTFFSQDVLKRLFQESLLLRDDKIPKYIPGSSC